MSEVRLACVVQHHPARAEILPRLLERLEAPIVVTDPGGPGISAWRCYRLCLRAAPEATHVLVIQDDTIPCLHFEESARAAIEACPCAAGISFYLGGQPATTAHAATLAMKRGEHWARIARRDWVPTVATCYPQAIAQELAAWVDERYPDSRGDDAPVGHFFRAHPEYEVFATVPSLVSHPDDTPSLVGRKALGGKNPARIAKWWIGDADARKIEW